jgi:hypothetical protein
MTWAGRSTTGRRVPGASGAGVPLHSAPPAPLAATADVARSALRHLLAGAVPATEHLDVDPGEWCGHTADLAGEVAAEVEHISGLLSGSGVGACACSAS